MYLKCNIKQLTSKARMARRLVVFLNKSLIEVSVKDVRFFFGGGRGVNNLDVKVNVVKCRKFPYFLWLSVV